MVKCKLLSFSLPSFQKKTAVLGLNTPGIGSRAPPQPGSAQKSSLFISETLVSLLCLAALHEQLGSAPALYSLSALSLTENAAAFSKPKCKMFVRSKDLSALSQPVTLKV